MNSSPRFHHMYFPIPTISVKKNRSILFSGANSPKKTDSVEEPMLKDKMKLTIGQRSFVPFKSPTYLLRDLNIQINKGSH